MGLDSVEIVMAWEESLGVMIENSEAFELRTPRQSIDLIALKLGARESESSPCLSMRAFHRLRDAISKTTDVPRRAIRPDSRAKKFLSAQRSREWAAIRTASGIPRLPEPGWLAPHTMHSLVDWVVCHSAKDLKSAGEPWTVGEIRCVVRAVVTEVTASRGFSDDDDFVRDIGVN